MARTSLSKPRVQKKTPYAERNVARILELRRENRAKMKKLWTGRDHDQSKLRQWGRETEDIAEQIILPALGFTDIMALNKITGNATWDFAATKNGCRVLVDASSCVQKDVRIKNRMAEAIGLDLYVLFVSPRDHRFHHLHRVRKGTGRCDVPLATFIKAIEAQNENHD